ncbi:phosphotransferase [Paenibacillus pinistramenti]|uniref:phosphotransferase n=1 Tax=Paenibacillus pinistramenti TaxID=1768003 RepID=UPI001EEF84AE|nr:phosphotransferase [Paenibacillus pinistramenti]
MRPIGKDDRMHKHLEQLLEQYGREWRGTPERREGGWNNSTWLIKKESGSTAAVLRLYETHRDPARIKFEHAVLAALHQAGLSVQTPVPVAALTGETFLRLDDGSERYACLFQYIEGLPAKDGDIRCAYSFGQAAGELAVSLAAAEEAIGLAPVYSPYYDLLKAYPDCTPESVHAFCMHPPEPFWALKEPLAVLEKAWVDVCSRLGGLEQLPQQLVHGDLNYSNLLVKEQEPRHIAALLDFEFCTRDAAVMEPAVVLAGLLEDGRDDGEDGEVGKKEGGDGQASGDVGQTGQEAMEEFCRGYGERVRYSPEEIQAIPVLIALRSVDVFLHFLSRYWNGTDGPDVLQQQIRLLSASLNRLEASRRRIEEAAGRFLLQTALS